MTVYSYNEFVRITKSLEAWDPNSQYITKYLSLNNKPKKNSYCQRFFSIFRRSKSSQAVAAATIINAYAIRYKTQLESDKDTVRLLRKFNKKMAKNLGETQADHVLKNQKKREELQKQCEAMNTLCKKLLKTKTISSSLSSSSSSPSSLSSSSTSSTLSSLTPSTSSLDSSSSHGSKNSAVPFNSFSQLNVFRVGMNPSSAKEATELLENLLASLKQSDLTVILEERNGNLLLKKISEIKHTFAPDKKLEPNLRKAALQLRILIRKRFFADRIRKMREQVKLIEGNVDKTLKGTMVPIIIEEWKQDLKKYKPISIPKYFHCTTSQYVNKIIRDPVGIIPQPKGIRKGYEGAFASSIPEQGKNAGAYGQFCFAISDYVEETAIAEKQAPIITNVNRFAKQGFLRDKEPIYVGNAAPKTKKDPAKHKGQPKIWLGFKQPIKLRKPNKANYPLGYYRNTTFCLFSYLVDRAGEFGAIRNSSLKDLQQRNIRIIPVEDFRLLVNLVQSSLHFVLPEEWKTKAKAPRNCTNIQVKTKRDNSQLERIPLKHLKGVKAS